MVLSLFYVGETNVDIPETWTLIATSSGIGYWEPSPGSIMSDYEARKMHAAGKILMAQKRLPDGKMGLLIKQGQKDDIEQLREMLGSGMSEVQVTHKMSWSHHRIQRIKSRAYKEGRPIVGGVEK